MTDDMLATMRSVSIFRVLAVAAAAIVLLLMPGNMQPAPLLALAAVYLLCLALVNLWLAPRFAPTHLATAMIVVDVLAITLALVFAGSPQSPLVALYPIAVILATICRGYTGAFLAAILATLGYGALLMATGTTPEVARALPWQISFIYVLAGIGGYLVEWQQRKSERAHSLHQMLRVERDAREMLRMTHELYSCLKEEEVLQRVANLACQITGLSRCVFALVDEDRKNIVGAATNVLLPAAGITRIQDLVVPIRQQGATETAMRTGNPVVVEDSRQDPRVPPELREQLGLVSLLIIPINVADQWVGVMYLDNAGQRHHFGADEIEVAKTLSEQAATAIANARLYSEAQERIQNLMSETRAMIETKEAPPRPTRPQALKCDNLEINLPQRRVLAAGNPVNLSWTEFELLRFLAANPASAFTRETIFRKVWKQEYYISTNLVDVCVHRLRQKIEANPAEPRYVVTVHGVGYMFAATPQRQ